MKLSSMPRAAPPATSPLGAQIRIPSAPTAELPKPDAHAESSKANGTALRNRVSNTGASSPATSESRSRKIATSPSGTGWCSTTTIVCLSLLPARSAATRSKSCPVSSVAPCAVIPGAGRSSIVSSRASAASSSLPGNVSAIRSRSWMPCASSAGPTESGAGNNGTSCVLCPPVESRIRRNGCQASLGRNCSTRDASHCQAPGVAGCIVT